MTRLAGDDRVTDIGCELRWARALDVGRVGRGVEALDWVAAAAEVERNEVIILVNGAERGETIDRGTARTAYDEAEQRLNQVNPEDKQALIQATQAVKRARAKLQAAEAVK